MAERHFNPESMFNKGPTPSPNIITLEQLLQYHAYFKSVPEPSEVMREIITQMETRLLTIISSFNAGTIQ
jgi:hypothetical protein